MYGFVVAAIVLLDGDVESETHIQWYVRRGASRVIS